MTSLPIPLIENEDGLSCLLEKSVLKYTPVLSLHKNTEHETKSEVQDEKDTG